MSNTDAILEWLESHDLNPLYGWDVCVDDAITGMLDFDEVNGMDASDAAQAVREVIEDVQNDPEGFGVRFPIYNGDIHEIWENNEADVEDAYAEWVEATGITPDSIWEGISSGVNWAVDTAVREVCSELVYNIDTLEELLNNAE